MLRSAAETMSCGLVGRVHFAQIVKLCIFCHVTIVVVCQMNRACGLSEPSPARSILAERLLIQRE